jgi:sugar lactone lactonase YvrE
LSPIRVLRPLWLVTAFSFGLVASGVLGASLLAEDVAETPAPLNAAAIKAYQQKDFAAFLGYEKRASALQPANPRFVYNVACGESLTGNGKEAVRLLSQLADRKLDLGAETDDDFATIRKLPEWASFEAKLAELRKPVVHSEIAFKLAETALVATGIAIDSRTGDTYVGSVRTRKIVRRTKTGEVSDFVHEAQDGFLAAGSLAIDSPRQIIYASSSAVPFMRGYRKEDADKSGVFAFDLKSGRLLRKVFLAPDGKPHFLNALLIDRDGNVYVSDSLASGIYRLRKGAEEFEVFVPKDVFSASQGLAFSDDEKTMFVVDYSDGLWALDMLSKERRHIDGPPDAWLAGLDGISRMGNSFITVQIGVRPERVLRLKLDAKTQNIALVEILEMSHREYDGPIQGVIDGHSFYYVANSQLRLGNGETGAFAEEQARSTVILRLPI